MPASRGSGSGAGGRAASTAERSAPMIGLPDLPAPTGAYADREGDAMVEILSRWHAEHAKFERLLALIEHELDPAAESCDPNAALLLDVVEYLKGWGDAFHHPREDVAFRRLLRLDPEAATLVERLLQEHRVIAQFGTEFAERLRHVRDGVIISRGSLESAAALYLVYYRHHLAKEEGTILPRIEKLFSNADWRDIEAEIDAIVEPTVDSQEQKRFELLRHRIASQAAREPDA